MTATLSPVAVQDFFIGGIPAVGAKLFVYAAGTTTKVNSFTDSTGSTPNTNPIIMNTRGEPEGSGGQSLGIWLTPGTSVKLVFTSPTDSDPPTSPIWSVDQVSPGGSGGGATGQASYPTIAAAEAAATPAGTTFVTISGYYSVADGGGGTYLPASAGAGPGKYEDANSNWWKLSAAKPNVKQFGAKGDGTANDAPAFSNALAFWGSTGGIITMPDAVYALSSGIIIPDFTYLQGDVFFPNLATIKGVELLFANGVATCVTGGTGSTNNPYGFENCIINRTGSPPSGSIGFLANQGQSPVIRNIGSINHAIPAYWKANSSGGITSHVIGLYTAAATDAHLVIDTWPELFFSQIRLGCNGAVDVNCNCYLRITGGGSGGSGPNTLLFDEWQFNQGQNKPLHGIEFVSLTNPGSNALEFKFGKGHLEALNSSGGVIYADASAVPINRLSLVDVTVNCPSTPMFEMNAAAVFSETAFIGGQYFVSTFAPPAEVFVATTVQAIECQGAATFNVSANSTIALANNAWGAGLTLAGAGNIFVSGDLLQGGSLTNSATGICIIYSPDMSGTRTWTPTVTIGGASTGITYSAQFGEYEYLTLTQVKLDFVVTLSNKGALTGNVQIAGMPVTANSFWGNTAGGFVTNFTLTSITGQPALVGINSATSLALVQGTSSGVGNITNANLSNTSSFQGSITLRV